MSENGTRMASFDHVDDRGDLVFVCDHRHFVVRVDDALDRAILEAKQVKEEEDADPQTGKSKPLPVSAIQAAVRAGARRSKWPSNTLSTKRWYGVSRPQWRSRRNTPSSSS